jgi:hypothetical protein
LEAVRVNAPKVKAAAANPRRVKREDVIACRKRGAASALQDARTPEKNQSSL